jgi:nitrite reductase/ring-hydroxylating ferredoxin subunit
VRLSFRSEELPEGARKVVSAGRREIVVLNDGGSLHALFNRCPHRQAALSFGLVRNGRREAAVGELRYADFRVLLCPWHRYEFDLATGRCPADPERLRIATYEVRREGDEIAVYV